MGDNLRAAFEHASLECPRILLAHEPDRITQVTGRGDLPLSGRSHRGQLDILGWRPFAPSQLPSRQTRCRDRVGGMSLIVSSGIGFSGLPLRIAALPEITHLTIIPDPEARI